MGSRISPVFLDVWSSDRKWILGSLGAEGGLVLAEKSLFPPATLRLSTRAASGFMGAFDEGSSFFWGLVLDRVMRGPDQT